VSEGVVVAAVVGAVVGAADVVELSPSPPQATMRAITRNKNPQYFFIYPSFPFVW